MNHSIILKKVSVHNLKQVDLELTPGEFIVFTGVSGSGKSSLAFDTIYVEGQRRYIESLSHQARRHLAELPKPDAESISGIAPTIAIEQKLSARTPRSTVGTLTGIYDFLRVLYARIGVPYCPVSHEPVGSVSKEKIIAQISALPQSTKIYLLAPLAKGKKGEFKEEFAELLRKGFTRLRVDGSEVDLSTPLQLDGKRAHDVEIIVDRIKIEPGARSRIAESVTTALEMGQGVCSLFNVDSEEETLFSQTAYSQKSGLSYEPLTPQDFSFNHPSGMCPACHGLGVSAEFDLEKIINPNLSIAEDCCAIGSSYQTIRYGNIYDNLARIFKFNINKSWKEIPEKAKHAFLYGLDQKWTRMQFTHPEKKSKWTEYIRWQGVLHEAKERLNAAKSDVYRKKMGELMIEMVCPACQGVRIKPYPAACKLGGKKIGQITALSLNDTLLFFENISLSALEVQIGSELLKEIRLRLKFLIDVGLGYLSLDRISPTLSGGESQRVRLASQIGSPLAGAIYVLDEPSIGLHPIDHHKLIETLLYLRDLGNTVIVVEHDADTILAADTVVDVGPLAGRHGGEIIAVGSPQKIMQEPKSLTGAYLSGKLKIEPSKKRKLSKEKIEIIGASHHNLKNLTVSLPLGALVCVTGVSGSGKSSLITGTLYPALANHFHHAKLPVGKHKKMSGIDALDKIIAIDQLPIGRTPRSNPATYIKLFDEIRDLFAHLPESRLRGFDAGHFSFNVKEGSCPYCGGMGSTRIDMDFMEDAWIECPQCKGRRFDPEVLAVQFKGKNIADILATDVEHALPLFDAIPSIHRKLSVLSLVGLDYLTLGQSSTTLSGGEAQRIKLAKELVRPSSGNTLYILDEPTTGLHFHDIRKLIAILQKLTDQGNTVVVIEHNLDFIKIADWIIDLGLGAGIFGGSLIGEGPPEKIMNMGTPTGKALQGLKPPDKRLTFKEKKPASIEIVGASQNNLKSISLSIPRGKITIFTGPSGSGKSSLAFDTLYAEGQRRYTETLSSYSRSMIKQLPKPSFEKIEGLSPAIALEQKTGGLNPRSTIGTITEIYDLLRVLYAHLGTAYCPQSGEKIRHISKEFVVHRILDLPKGEKIQILTPLQLQKKESFEDLIARLNRQGFLRIRLNQKVYELDETIPFEKHKKNSLLLVIDRLLVDPKSEKRLFEAVGKATSLSDGEVVIACEKGDLYFNLAFACEKTGKSYPPITPQTFSFNHDAGMCLECQGLGLTYGMQLTKNILRLSLSDLSLRLFKDKTTKGALKRLTQYFHACGIDLDEPLKNLSSQDIQLILHGGPEKRLPKFCTLKWIGLQPLFAGAIRMGNKEMKEALLPFMNTSTCFACEGTRLNPLARNVRIGTVSIADLCRMELKNAFSFTQSIPLKRDSFLKETVSQISKYLEFLLSIGLGYLTLERSAPTLSGGELQRIRLARQLGSGLTSCLYILDEPTIGLHPYNNRLLNQALKKLSTLGNTLILVEHDPMTLEIADAIFDFGPKAGREGGRICASGTLDEILQNPNSLTGAYLSHRKTLPIPKKRRPFHPDIRIENATLHNLKNISLAIPRAAITCLTGVSGSGKSTLMRILLKGAAEMAIGGAKEPIEYLQAKFWGLNAFEKVIAVDQSPIGQTARADVGSYTEIMPLIRNHFAQLPLAKAKGLQPRHFSSNHMRGMCRTCWGMGYKTVGLQFLPSVKVTCESCKGLRLTPLSLEVRYRGKNIGELLSLTIQEALQFFSEIPKIFKRLQLLDEVGLSYLQLGQELASLSGGEAQRLRLSRELAKRESGKTLYLIDEPTVGLHSSDIACLLPIFHHLANKRNTLIIIEHNLDVIASADYVIDLGPDAGDLGGRIMAQGTPEEVAQSTNSRTAPFLSQRLSPPN
ncbi:MAG TPA: excinuclease ABC subunit UvrA [Chlamydiales bacterium]|nr:excinuclease ABC subunit UvrA [Chlamydiales bacterium]